MELRQFGFTGLKVSALGFGAAHIGDYKLDEKAIAAALTDQRLAALVDQDIQTATARGVTKIPAVYVAGKAYIETIVYDDLAKTIDSALSR